MVCIFQPKFNTLDDESGEYLECGTPEQIKAYRQFAHFESMQFFIVAGVGCLPDHPERVFCIPVEDAGDGRLLKGACRMYERSRAGRFSYQNDHLE